MANSVSSKLPTLGSVIYDSVNDTPTGKKRAGIPSGGLSVAERARVFGTQVKTASSQNPQTERFSYNQQSKSNNVHQNTNNQQFNTNVDKRPKKEISHPTPQKESNNVHQNTNNQQFNTNVDKRPKKEIFYPTPQKELHHHRSPDQVDNGIKREKPSSASSYNYSTVTRPTTRQIPQTHNHNPPLSTRYQTSSSYDTYLHATPRRQQQASGKANYTPILPDELYASDDDPSLQLYDRQKASSYKTAPTSNYFQPTQDPLEMWFKKSSQGHPQPTTETNLSGMEPFDLGNLLNRIKQDYLEKVRPYVSSVKFVENNREYERSLANIGFLTPATVRRGDPRQSDDIYRRQVPSHHNDYIVRNGFRSYEKMHSKQPFDDNRYSSMDRRKHRARYHDQASSPIHILASSNNMDTRRQPNNPPVASIRKLPTPIVTSSSEEEEEVTTTRNQPELLKLTPQIPIHARSVTPSESSIVSEDDLPEHPSTTPSQPPLSKPVDESIRAPILTETQASPRSELLRPPLQNQTPSLLARTQASKKESEESQTEESKSDSDSDSDEEDEKPTPSLAARPNNQPTTFGTSIPRSGNTPQINVRAIPQRTNTDNTRDQLPESSDYIESYDPEDAWKSPSFAGRLKSFTNKFRRNKLALN